MDHAFCLEGYVVCFVSVYTAIKYYQQMWYEFPAPIASTKTANGVGFAVY